MITKIMVQILITVGTIILLSTSIASAQTWTVMREGQFKADFDDVVFVDANNGWAVGGWSGVIVHTSDGGATWEEQINPVVSALWGVDFVNKTVGWAVGNGILHTSDGGSTWKQQVGQGQFPYLYDVDFVNESSGWAVGDGGTIRHTSDGGATWGQQNSTTNNRLNSVAFVNENLGWAVGDGGVILHTEDGGSAWEQQTSPTTDWFGSVVFVNETTGWAMSYAIVCHTTDGGKTWEAQAAGGAGRYGDFINENIGWVVHEGGDILYTSDGGKTWEHTKVQAGPLGVDFVDENVGWIVGRNGVILYTSDGGETWERQTNPCFHLYDVAFVNDNQGWAVGDCGTILHTSDGGKTWEEQTLPADAGNSNLRSVTFVNASEGWAAGGCGAILHTSDGGTTWEYQRPDCWDLQDITFVNSNLGWIVGGNLILHTSDGGQTWEQQFTLPNNPLRGVDFVNENSGWAVAGGWDDWRGTILHTSNGGETWEVQYGPTTNFGLYAVDFVNENLGWAVGGDEYKNIILHTSDGGITWEIQFRYEANRGSLNDVVFVNENTGWAVGGVHDNIILHTSNGGETWEMQGNPTVSPLHGVAFANGNLGWAVGNWGIILKHTPIGDVSGNGSISAYDASLILQFVVGLIDKFPAQRVGAPDSTPRDYTVSIPQLSVKAGDKIHVPLVINDATGLFAGGISVKYDPTVLKAVDVAPLTLISSSYWKGNTDLNGEVRFAFVTVEPPKGGGNLLEITFEVLPNTEGRVSPLALSNIDLRDSLTITMNNGAVTVLPSQTALLPNFPNPFNPETWIPFKLAEMAPVTIRIYDQKGQIIRTLDFGSQQAGSYVTKDKAAYWDGKNEHGERVSSGVYFYQLKAGKFSAVRKMVIIK